jgi:hypothetical protein
MEKIAVVRTIFAETTIVAGFQRSNLISDSLLKSITMKQTNARSHSRCSHLISLVIKFRDPAVLCILIFFTLCSGCFKQFYLTNTANHIDSATLMKLIGAQKYFILHDLSHNREYALDNVKVFNENLVADMGPLLSEHTLYEHPLRPVQNAFLVKDKDVVLYEVHLYSQNPGDDSMRVNIALKDFSRVDVYELDKKSTNRHMVGSIIGITLTTAGAIVAIVAIAETGKSSSAPSPSPTPSPSQNSDLSLTCSPQVYLKEHNKTELQGTLYSGAIAASLERTDYMPLSIGEHADEKVRLTIKGKDEEDIMLNRVQLMQVTHKESEQVLIDRNGKIQVYHDPVKPRQALIGPDKDVRMEIMARDGKYYSFTNQSVEENSSDILLNFRKPHNSTSGKLIVNAKNSAWSYYLFNQFKSLYGDYYPSLIQKKDKADPAQVMRCELDQYLPLLVSVKYKEEWKFVDYFPTAGISASRDLIMNLDLKEFRDSDNVQIRLQTTYMFWDLDYVAMDFSTRDNFQNEFIPASKVLLVNRDSEEIIPETDQHSNIIVKGPLRLDIEFDVHSHPSTGMKNSYFLVGNGYYHDNSRFEGEARFRELVRFSGKGAFDKYSREKFDLLLSAMQENENNVTRTSK